MALKWRLRQVMADRGIWSGAELGRLMEQKAGYKLSEDPATWIQPDVSFLKMERVRATKPNDHFLGAPELAVEVVSPSETAETLNRKIDLLLGREQRKAIYGLDVMIQTPQRGRGRERQRGTGHSLLSPFGRHPDVEPTPSAAILALEQSEC